VEVVDDFSDMTHVLALLQKGFIVVSKKHSEPGVEYFSPFRDTLNGALVVAAVQCKFVTHRTLWGEILTKMNQATEELKTRNIEWFPVVYTTADVRQLQSVTYANGVYFTATDIFDFTSRVGVLRLHTQKLGEILGELYPQLARARSEIEVDK
jgi:hypothetical protein